MANRHIITMTLALLLALAAPGWADEDEDYTTRALGQRWYQIVMDPFTLEAGETRAIYIPLDETPGGVESTPALYVKPLSAGAARTELTLSMVSFAPGIAGGYTAHVMVTLENRSGHAETYRLKAIVRGGE